MLRDRQPARISLVHDGAAARDLTATEIYTFFCSEGAMQRCPGGDAGRRIRGLAVGVRVFGEGRTANMIIPGPRGTALE